MQKKKYEGKLEMFLTMPNVERTKIEYQGKIENEK